jgi:hypothetical protein
MKEQAFTPTSIRWPADLKAAIEKAAFDEDRTFSSYVIHVMRQHIAKQDKSRRS